MERDILVPLAVGAADSSLESLVAAQARVHDAAVILLHVLPGGVLRADQVTTAEARARAYLDGVAAALRNRGVQVKPLLRSGEPRQIIVEEAEARRVALLMLGQRRETSRFAIHRSVPRQVVHQVSCPVLLAPVSTERRCLGGVLALPSPGPLASRSLGIRTVSLSQIVGSASRAAELRADFQPRRPYPEDERRFEAILAALRRGEVLPPIEVFKLGFGYYVSDGHHRVAAALRLGLPAIASRVTALVPVGDSATSHALARRAAFEQATGLTRVGATRAASYDWLLEAVQAYGMARGIGDLGAAADRWCGEVFFPLRRRIRAAGITRFFPGERPADIVARLVEWHVSRTGRVEPPPSWDEALVAFVATISETDAA